MKIDWSSPLIPVIAFGLLTWFVNPNFVGLLGLSIWFFLIEV